MILSVAQTEEEGLLFKSVKRLTVLVYLLPAGGVGNAWWLARSLRGVGCHLCSRQLPALPDFLHLYTSPVMHAAP